MILFNGVEELDVVGPWEVFQEAAQLNNNFSCRMISYDGKDVSAAKGLQMGVHGSMAEDLIYDLILLPGGRGTRALMKNEAFLARLHVLAKNATWVTSVCTGSLVYATAGLLANKKCTSHHAACDALEALNMTGEVLRNIRYVQDDKYITAAGVSAGIDMSLWLLGQIEEPAFAKKVQHAIEYYPQPPYAEHEK